MRLRELRERDGYGGEYPQRDALVITGNSRCPQAVGPTVWALQMRAVHDALHLFEVSMSTEVLARGERKSGKEKLRRYSPTLRGASRLAAVVGVLLEASECDAPVIVDGLCDTIENEVSRSALRARVSDQESLAAGFGAQVVLGQRDLPVARALELRC